MNNFKPSKTMLNNYTQNKLSDSETEQLELWLVDHPDVMEDLEMGEMFKQSEFDHNVQNESIKNPSWNILNFFTNRRMVPIHIFAYGLIGLLLINTLSHNKNTLQTSVATLIELEKQRGLETSTIEVHSQARRSLVLRLFPDSMDENYTLLMDSKTTAQKFEFKNLQSDDFGSITVALMTDNVYGKWQISLINQKDNNQQHYIINVVK